MPQLILWHREQDTENVSWTGIVSDGNNAWLGAAKSVRLRRLTCAEVKFPFPLLNLSLEISTACDSKFTCVILSKRMVTFCHLKFKIFNYYGLLILLQFNQFDLENRNLKKEKQNTSILKWSKRDFHLHFLCTLLSLANNLSKQRLVNLLLVGN